MPRAQDTSLPDTFLRLGTEVLSKHPRLRHEWTSSRDGKRTLLIPRADESGFDVRIECETYGLYPFAGEWHGAPWDAPKTSLDEVCRDCLGFVRSLLCADSRLIVSLTNGRPFRWTLEYPLGGAVVRDRVGLLLFNYFGRRTTHEYQNRHLPPRDGAASAGDDV
jgi:hypothetical protein